MPGNREWMTEGDGEVSVGDVPGAVYVGVADGDTIAAIAAQPLNSVCAHIHFCMHPTKRARKFTAAKALLQAVRARMFDMAIFCFVPADNRGIQGIIKRAGMTQVGVLRRAHRRNMERHDMLIFEVQDG